MMNFATKLLSQYANISEMVKMMIERNAFGLVKKSPISVKIFCKPV